MNSENVLLLESFTYFCRGDTSHSKSFHLYETFGSRDRPFTSGITLTVILSSTRQTREKLWLWLCSLLASISVILQISRPSPIQKKVKQAMDSLFLTTPALVALSLCHLWFFFQFYLFTISTICNHLKTKHKNLRPKNQIS